MEYKFGVEFDWNFLAAAANDRSFNIPGRSLAHTHLNTLGVEQDVNQAGIRDESLKLDLMMELSRPAELWRFPIETISQSDNGFERGFQSTVLFPHWSFRLKPGASWDLVITHTLKYL